MGLIFTVYYLLIMNNFTYDLNEHITAGAFMEQDTIIMSS